MTYLLWMVGSGMPRSFKRDMWVVRRFFGVLAASNLLALRLMYPNVL